jgi:hypothetical protein
MKHHPKPYRARFSPVFRVGSRRASTFLTQVLGLFLVGTLTACIGGPPAPLGQPDWVNMEPSWSRLDAIERWLDTAGVRADPTQRLEAELLLAEGRLDFALEDRARNPNAHVAARVDSALDGFRRVQRSSAANDSQRRRADAGLLRAERLDSVATARPLPANVPSGAIPRSVWRAERADESDMARASGAWRRLTVHHTNMEGVPAPPPGAGEAANAAYLRRVQRAHMTTNNWADIGYEFLIDMDGRLWEGRSLTWIGAHAGRSGTVNNNVDNIGISLFGNFENVAPSQAALDTLAATLDSFRSRYGIGRGSVYGHREFKNTACPGDVLMNWVNRYRGTAAASPSRSSSSPKSGTKSRVASLYGFPTDDDAVGESSAASATAR